LTKINFGITRIFIATVNWNKKLNAFKYFKYLKSNGYVKFSWSLFIVVLNI